jgi:hypothetical protein
MSPVAVFSTMAFYEVFHANENTMFGLRAFVGVFPK